jgi:hypothetical protein
VTRLSPARLVLVALLGAAVALIAVELSIGAISFGEAKLADPCKAQPHVSEGGIFGSIDAAIQRVALSGLNGAACSLHTSREELVLSFAPAAGTKKVRWSRATIEKALRGGIARAAGGGLLGRVVADVLADPVAYLIGELSG